MMKTFSMVMTLTLFILNLAEAEDSQPIQPVMPVGITGEYETVQNEILKVYSVEDNGARFRAYVVEWKGQEVIVSDELGQTNKEEGDTITFMAQRIEMPQDGQKIKLLHFMIVEFPGMPTNTIE